MNCVPPPRRAKAIQVATPGRATPSSRTRTADILASKARRLPANVQSPRPTSVPGRTNNNFCVHMIAAPRQSPPPQNHRSGWPRGACSTRSPCRRHQSAATNNVSAGTSGRISRVLWINIGCPARNNAARRATRRVVPRRATRKIRTTESAVSASDTSRPKIRKCRAESKDRSTANHLKNGESAK